MLKKYNLLNCFLYIIGKNAQKFPKIIFAGIIAEYNGFFAINSFGLFKSLKIR